MDVTNEKERRYFSPNETVFGKLYISICNMKQIVNIYFFFDGISVILFRKWKRLYVTDAH